MSNSKGFDIKLAMQPPPDITPEPETAKFPTYVYPKMIQGIIKNSTLPKDFYGAAMLSVTAAGAGACYNLNVQGDDFHTQPLIFFNVLMADSAIKKTPIVKRIEKPFEVIDNASADEYKELKRDYDEIMSLSAKERRERQISSLPCEPMRVKILEDRPTMESLSVAHLNNPKGILWSPDEIMSLFGNLNRYNTGNNDDTLNKLYDGRKLDERYKTTASIYLSQTNVNIFGTMQPQRIREMLTPSRMASGLFARFNFISTDEISLARKELLPVDKTISAQYDDYVMQLCNLKFDGNPKLIELNRDAWQLFLDWDVLNKAEILDNRASMIGTLLSKKEAKLLRAALTLQIMSDTIACKETTEVTPESFVGAVKIADYFHQSSLIVYAQMQSDPALDDIDGWKKQLYNLLPDSPASFHFKEALGYSKKLAKSERHMQRFLAEKKYFTSDGQGNYRKRI